jgi:2'-5' RNA ligase
MRLFYCVELPQAVRAELYAIAQPLRKTEARVRWVRPENFHITLKFLGEVERSALDALTALGAQVAAKFPKSEITFDTVGAFPDTRRPRVLWIGSRQAPQALFDLHAHLERELMKMGFEAERHFAPHVTVGRVKDEHRAHVGQLAQLLAQVAPFACRAPITHVTLMESQLSPGGAIYTPVATWELYAV